jgi:hypothetical protein
MRPAGEELGGGGTADECSLEWNAGEEDAASVELHLPQPQL